MKPCLGFSSQSHCKGRWGGTQRVCLSFLGRGKGEARESWCFRLATRGLWVWLGGRRLVSVSLCSGYQTPRIEFPGSGAASIVSRGRRGETGTNPPLRPRLGPHQPPSRSPQSLVAFEKVALCFTEGAGGSAGPRSESPP
ncbi:unnamed protein product [Caretta caretta]